MKSNYKVYIATLRKGDEVLKLYYYPFWRYHEVFDVKSRKCVWTWQGMEVDEILPCYSYYKKSFSKRLWKI